MARDLQGQFEILIMGTPCTQLSLVGHREGRAAGPEHGVVSLQTPWVASPSTAGPSPSLRLQDQ